MNTSLKRREEWCVRLHQYFIYSVYSFIERVDEDSNHQLLEPIFAFQVKLRKTFIG
jgi:hypothetical protein